MAVKLFEYQKGLDKLVIYDAYLEYGCMNISIPIKQINKVVFFGWGFLNVYLNGSNTAQPLLSWFVPKEVKEKAKEILLNLL